jgi:PAS domain S-box-containing protein
MDVQETPGEQTKGSEIKLDKLHFSHWPAFASFIREGHMVTYAKELLRYSREAELPIMKFIAHLSEEQLLELTIKAHGEFLENVEKNILREHLEAGLKKWEANDLQIISSDDIATEDITVGSFIRKKALLTLLPLYTTDPFEILEIIKEIDIFDTESVTASTKLHINILKGKIQEQLHFIEKISNTTPGLSYVYDVAGRMVKYANSNYVNYFGYTLEDIQLLGDEFISISTHPNDVAKSIEIMTLVAQMSNLDILTLENRMKNAQGHYRWMRHYYSVFKRDANGQPTEVVGIALDIEKEKRASEQLAYREEQLLEAQAIGELGSFEWVFADQEKTTVTPQLLRIFGLDDVLGFEHFMDHIHPTDRPRVRAEIDKAIKETAVYECEYRYIKNSVEKIIWSRGMITYDSTGAPYSMKGTIMDVTERHHMIHRLQRSEELYKQAQALSHMGNYAYDIINNHIHWTDEIYRIFGMEPQAEEIDLDKFMSFVHPDDKEYTAEKIKHSIENRTSHDFCYRIALPDGTEKIIQARGEVLTDEHGVVYKFLGTAQDVTERQKLIENLQQAQAMAHVGNWTWDLATDKITWSKEVFNIYEIEQREGELKRADYTYLRHPDDVEYVDSVVKKLRETGEPQDYYFRMITPAGKTKYIHTRAEAVLDSNGKTIELFGTLQDVTEKQEFINKLQDSEALYKQAQAMSHVGNWIWDPTTGEVTWSDELFSIYDVPFNEGARFDVEYATSFRHPEDDAYVSEMIQKVIDTRTQQVYRYRIISNKGEIKIMDAITEPILDANGKLQKVIGTIQDITEKVLIEQQANKDREFIEKIADTAPSIITTYNINTGKYNFVSQGISKLLGFEAKQVLEEGVPFFNERLHPDDIASVTEQNIKILELANRPENINSTIIEEFKYRVKDINGKYRWLHTYATVFDRGHDGKVLHVLNVSVDITAQVEAELELQQKNIELQRSNSSLEDYAYVASHDLKEPLRKISTFSDRLISTQQDNLSDEGKLYLTKIMDSSTRMQSMISDLLTVSTISGNRTFEEYSLQKAVNEATLTIEHKIEEKNSILNIDDLPVARVVPSQFRQLFQNLVSNSLKFSREGVQPVISIQHTYLRPDQLDTSGVAKAERYLKIIFTDNGIGFDNTYAEKIFSIFQRLHNRTQYEGTGIGLAICRKVAENHGGVITAEGTPGEGATFTLIIPA